MIYYDGDDFVMMLYSNISSSMGMSSTYGKVTIISTACSSPLVPTSNWTIDSYLKRTDPSASVTGFHKMSAWGGTTAYYNTLPVVGGTDRSRRKVDGEGMMSPSGGPSPSRRGKNKKGKQSGNAVTTTATTTSSPATTTGVVYPMEVLLKKCIHLMGFSDSTTSSKESCGMSKTALGIDDMNFVRATMWNGEGENSGICVATIHVLGALAEVSKRYVLLC